MARPPRRRLRRQRLLSFSFWSHFPSRQALPLGLKMLQAEPPEALLQFAALAPRHGTKTQSERIQLDEPLRIELVISALVIFKRHMLHRIEAIG